MLLETEVGLVGKPIGIGIKSQHVDVEVLVVCSSVEESKQPKRSIHVVCVP